MRECSGVSPWHTLEAPHNIQLTIPTLAPTPASTSCCCVLTPPGPPTPLWAQHQGLPALKDSSQLHISHQHLWLPPALDWASLPPPWPPATAPTPCAGTSLGAGFSPIMGEAPAHCRVAADTQEPAFLFLVNGTKTLPQIINSSPKSLYQPLEAFRVWLSGSNHSPRRHPQACVKDYQQWLRPLLHPARKGPFTALGTCSPGEPQAKGCTFAPGPNPEHRPNILQ